MKIAIISTYRLGNETGAAKVGEELAHKLSEKNKVLFVCLGDKYKTQKPKNNLTYIKIPSVFAGKGYAPILTPKSVNSLYKNFSSFSPQIIHSQSIVFASLTGLVWAKRHHIPFVLTFHSLPSEGTKWIFPKMKDKKVLSTIDYVLSATYVKKFVEQVNLVITLNKPVEDSLKKLKIKTETRRIPNGLILNRFYKLKIKKPNNIKKFVFLGSYVPRKNQEFLVKVFSNLSKNYQLSLYGNKKTGRDYYKKLIKLKKRLSCNNVFLNDFVDNRKVVKVFEKSDYLVSASTKEVQSLVVIESLASGTPVVGLKNETFEEIINSKIGLTISSKTDPKTYAKKLEEFVKNNKNSYKNIALGCRKFSKRYDIDNTLKVVISAYKYTIRNFPKQNPSRLLKIVPSQFKETFSSILPKPKQKTLPIKIYLFLTVSFSTIILLPLKFIILVLKKFKLLKEVIK